MEVYHERQRQMLCAVHTLNNLFQERNAYSKADLDAISYNLSPDSLVNPHKNVFGLGNYDVNVLMAALQLRDYEAVWFDKRLSLESLELQHIFGFVVNKPSSHSSQAISRLLAVASNFSSKSSQVHPVNLQVLCRRHGK
ncbi:josephin-1-like isoform X2 [Montipora capricornis]|uniref:josephin-1-like isoform X2 n=1 Tax=Montipora capricornis TaxID=246305 RepID=UPI0035F20658